MVLFHPTRWEYLVKMSSQIVLILSSTIRDLAVWNWWFFPDQKMVINIIINTRKWTAYSTARLKVNTDFFTLFSHHASRLIFPFCEEFSRFLKLDCIFHFSPKCSHSVKLLIHTFFLEIFLKSSHLLPTSFSKYSHFEIYSYFFSNFPTPWFIHTFFTIIPTLWI